MHYMKIDLEKYREVNTLTQQQVAEHLGEKVEIIQEWEREKKAPSLAMYCLLALKSNNDA